MGEVFLLRANIAAVGSVLDSPEVFWVIIVLLSLGKTNTDELRPVVPRPATALRSGAELSRDSTTYQPTQHPRRGTTRHATTLERVCVESTFGTP